MLAVALGTLVGMVVSSTSPSAKDQAWFEISLQWEPRPGDSNATDMLELFYDDGRGIHPNRRWSWELFRDDSPVTLRMPLPARNMVGLRLDPVARDGTLRILSTSLHTLSGREMPIPLESWEAQNQILSLELTPRGLLVIPEEGATDPQIVHAVDWSFPKNGWAAFLNPWSWTLLVVSGLGAWWLWRGGSGPRLIGRADVKDLIRISLVVASGGILGAVLIPGTVGILSDAYREKIFFEVDLASSNRTHVEIFYNIGGGYWPGHGGRTIVHGGGKRETARIEIPPAPVLTLRFDPATSQTEVEIFAARLVSSKGSLKRELSLRDIHARHQVRRFTRGSDRILVSTLTAEVPGQILDPQLEINLEDIFPGHELAPVTPPGAWTGFLLGAVLALGLLLRLPGKVRRGGSPSSVTENIGSWGKWARSRPARFGTFWVVAGLLGLALVVRVLAIYAIYPGDAPDERSHMALLVAMSHGEILSVHEENPMTGYAFSIYNPAGYIPSALLLHRHWGDRLVGQHPSRDTFMTRLRELQEIRRGWEELPEATRPNWFDYVSAREFKGHAQFSFDTNYRARWGHFLWGAAYLLMIIPVIRPYRRSEQILLVGLLAFVPQIVYVQSYLNLDSMGLFVALYLFWAVRGEKLYHIAFACFLAAFCKANYYCIYFLPAVYLFFRYWFQWKEWIRLSLLWFGPAFLVMVGWNLVVHQLLNPDLEGGALAIAALYGEEPGGAKVFQWLFLDSSLNSAFAHFGYLYQTLPIAWSYDFWKFVLLPVAMITLILSVAIPMVRQPSRLSKMPREWILLAGVLTVVLVNIAIHYYASYGINGYSPQGRYMFGGLVMLFCTLPLATSWMSGSLGLLRVGLNTGVGLLFVYFTLYSLPVMNLHETGFGFDYRWTGEPMENRWERIERFYPF